MNTADHQNHARDIQLTALLHGFADMEGQSSALLQTHVNGIVVDSRRVQQGSVFLAIPGGETDGRNYVEAALDAGACAILYENEKAPAVCEVLADKGLALGIDGLRGRVGPIASRFYGDPSSLLSITGITGTNGKTTCAWLLTQALEHLGERCAMMGTIGVGFPHSLSPSALTTADAVSIQQHLAYWLDAGATAVSMEVSSHGLDQERVNGIRFESAVFTNLTRDHLDYHGDMVAYAAAKKKLFQMAK